MVRRVLGVIIGFLVGFVCVAVILAISSWVYPVPPDLDFSDPEVMKRYVATLPLGAFLFVLVAHGFGPFVGSFTCAAIVRQRWLAGSLIVGAFFWSVESPIC